MSELIIFSAGGYLPASFLDWDGHVAAVIFASGCNFRCPWCHNSELVTARTESIPLPEIVADIKRRSKFLDGVVVSGGEPCLWNGLIPLLHELKSLHLPVKIDTNGSQPSVISQVLEEKLASCIAMDVKAPLRPDKLKKVTGVEASVDDIRKSIGIIREMAESYEFRTTYVPGLLSIDDLIAVRRELNDDSHWVVQCFRPVSCIEPEYMSLPAVKAADLIKMLPGVKIRG